jgi:large subunit ribosomal protein L15
LVLFVLFVLRLDYCKSFEFFFFFSKAYSQAFGPSSKVSSKHQYKVDQLQMKIFDWKKRQEFENYKVPDGSSIIRKAIYYFNLDISDFVLSVTTLSPIPGSRKKFLRVGRGISAGQGKTCGRGMRGQKSRKGEGRGVRLGFEGGQTALYRRLPKFQGKPQKGHTKTVYELIKLEMLNSVEDNSEVDYAKLFESGVVTKANKGRKIFKVVGGAELTARGLTIRAHAFTESARAAIEGNGGQCIVLSPTRHIPIEQAIADQAVLDAARLVKLKELRALRVKRDDAKALASA